MSFICIVVMFLNFDLVVKCFGIFDDFVWIEILVYYDWEDLDVELRVLDLDSIIFVLFIVSFVDLDVIEIIFYCFFYF